MNRDLIRRADASFTKWQRGMIFEKKIHRVKWEEAPEEVRAPIRRRQVELIEAVTDGPTELVRYLRSRLRLESDEMIEAPPFPRKELTPDEYKDPPVELEEELGADWKDVLEDRAALASSPLFWLLCHIVWIEDGRLGADGLALEEAMLSGAEKRERRIRNFLRRTGGLPRVRGNTSVFSDCRLARAWWRFHLADEVNRTTEGRIERGAAHWLFHLHRPSWETLVTLSLRRVTTINQPSARAAIAYHLGKGCEPTVGSTRRMLRLSRRDWLAYRCAARWITRHWTSSMEWRLQGKGHLELAARGTGTRFAYRPPSAASCDAPASEPRLATPCMRTRRGGSPANLHERTGGCIWA